MTTAVAAKSPSRAQRIVAAGRLIRLALENVNADEDLTDEYREEIQERVDRLGERLRELFSPQVEIAAWEPVDGLLDMAEWLIESE